MIHTIRCIEAFFKNANKICINWKILLYIEGCESQFFRFNRSMTYWYTMLSPGGAIIANKYLCLKRCSEKIWNFGSDPGPIHNFFGEQICGSDPDRTQNFPKKVQPLCEKMRWSRKSRPRGIHVKFDSLSYGKTYTILY